MYRTVWYSLSSLRYSLSSLLCDIAVHRSIYRAVLYSLSSLCDIAFDRSIDRSLELFGIRSRLCFVILQPQCSPERLTSVLLINAVSSHFYCSNLCLLILLFLGVLWLYVFTDCLKFIYLLCHHCLFKSYILFKFIYAVALVLVGIYPKCSVAS
jgi:hypothetical protein